MKKLYRLSLSVLFISFYLMSSNCQNKNQNSGDGDQQKNIFSSPDSAAQRGIEVLTTLASNEKLKGATSLSADQVKQLKVGKAIAIQEMSYNDLLKASLDSVPPPPAINVDAQSKWLYPLQLNDNTMTTTLVTKSNDGWKLTSAGDNTNVELINAQKQKNDSIVSLLEVPGLKINFLRYRTSNGIFYSSNRSIPELKVEKGQLIPERQALNALASYARTIEEKYGKDIKNKKISD